MKLRDRIAAWFGYVPVNSCEGCTLRYVESVDRMMRLVMTATDEPLTKSVASVIVSADFKRGIPCS